MQQSSVRSETKSKYLCANCQIRYRHNLSKYCWKCKQILEKERLKTKRKKEKLILRKQILKERKALAPTAMKKDCDELFSKIIRYRDGKCAFAGCDRKDLQNAHFIERGNLKFRYDEKNCKALCYKHHIHFWHSKDPFVAREALEWFRTAYPDTYRYVEQHRNDPPMTESINWIELKEKLEIRLEELKK